MTSALDLYRERVYDFVSEAAKRAGLTVVLSGTGGDEVFFGYGHFRRPLLLEALGDALPREVWDRPKMGFTFPFDLWMRQRAEDLEAASASTKWFQRSAVETVWRDYKTGRLHWSRPWTLVVLAAFEACRKTVATA